jgi:transcriptional regulator with XRE-family HTH domain
MEDITKNNFLKSIGKNVKRIRLLRGLSQETLANDFDKSINFVSLIERGESGLSIQTLIDLCRILEVDVNSIFEGVIAPSSKMTDDYITKSLNLFNNKDKTIITDLINYIINSKN